MFFCTQSMSPVKEALMSNKQMYSATSVTVPVKTCANAMFCLSKVLWKRHPGPDQPGGGHDVTSSAVTNANQSPEIAGRGPRSTTHPLILIPLPFSWIFPDCGKYCVHPETLNLFRQFANFEMYRFGNNLPSYITCLSGPALAGRPPHENAILLSPFLQQAFIFFAASRNTHFFS